MTRPSVPLALALLASVGAAAGTVLAAPAAAIVIDPSTPSFGQEVAFSWSGGGDDVNLTVWCFANATTLPAQPAGTQLLVTGARLAEDGVFTQPAFLTFGPTSNWTGGGADCTAQVGVITYSGNSGNYQQKFTSRPFTVSP